MEGNELKYLVFKRLGLKPHEFVECPRQKSMMTPCVAADGDTAMFDKLMDKRCVGCLSDVIELLNEEKNKHE